MLLDPFMASLKSKTSSIDPYSKGEVWSLLSALEVPYTPEKIILTKIMYGLPLLLQKNFCATPPTRGSLSKI